ncbi:unnamed protein product [Danaus chrysippus]|uniref:(African queen) hypothetical protein n=1 Tax=Danaus chrysippus TaxID=151541 RepID=A0A8J2R5A7_9NEOP|nr:unnamed protein product [Danaus chrysippus]
MGKFSFYGATLIDNGLQLEVSGDEKKSGHHWSERLMALALLVTCPFVSAKLNQRDPVGSCFVAQTPDAIEVNEFLTLVETRATTRGKTGMCQAGFFSSCLQVTVGDFAGQGIQGVAVGVPRGSELRGLVTVPKLEPTSATVWLAVTSTAMALTTSSLEHQCSPRPRVTDMSMEEIYVIYQGSDRSFPKRTTPELERFSKGRFGLAVTSLGDINYDGFGGMRRIWFIMLPISLSVLRMVVRMEEVWSTSIMVVSSASAEKYSQAITAEEISPVLTTFGFSLSGGVDLDNNNYTDLAVGAYKSDSVVFLNFHILPVDFYNFTVNRHSLGIFWEFYNIFISADPVQWLKVMAEVRFMGESKLISLDDRRCVLSNGTNVACARLMFCLTYDGVNVDQQINFEVTLDLDSRQKTSKAPLPNGVKTNNIYDSHITESGTTGEEIRDKLTPLEVKMTYELVQPGGSAGASGAVPPVLDRTLGVERTDSLNIQKNCGPDNVFNYVLGSGENVHIDVKVENGGEDAFETAYYLQIPAGVTYAKMERLDKDTAETSPIYCSIKNKGTSGNSTLKCDLGNPMASGQSVNFRVVLEVDTRVTGLNFDMESNSTNPEVGTQYDNTRHLAIGVIIKAVLSVIGTSDPPELHYNASLYESRDLKDDTKNSVPRSFISTTSKTKARISCTWWVQPQWAGDIVCDVARNVNPDNLFIQKPYAYMLTKEKEEMMSSEFYSGAQIGGAGGYYGQLEDNMLLLVKEMVNSMVNILFMLVGVKQRVGPIHLCKIESSSHGSGYGQNGYSQGGQYYGREQSHGGQSFNVQGGQGIGSAEYGQDGRIVRIRNKTVVFDSNHNVISESETSTEYGSWGMRVKLVALLTRRALVEVVERTDLVHKSTRVVNKELSKVVCKEERLPHTENSGSYSYSSSQSGGHRSYSQSGGTQFQFVIGTETRKVDTELKEMLSRCEEKYKCSVVAVCHTGRLVKGQAVWVALRSRINSSVPQ